MMKLHGMKIRIRITTQTLLILYAITLVMILHWRIFLVESWPKVLYVSESLGFLALIAKTLNINFLQLKEVLYFILDIMAISVLINSLKLMNLNSDSRTVIAIVFLALAYFTLYPYNKVSDAGFTPLYVIYSIGSAITIYLILYTINVIMGYVHSRLSAYKVLKCLSKPLFYLALLTIITMTIGQWDLRILLYPFVLLSLFLITLMFLTLITIIRKRGKHLKFLFVQLFTLVTPLAYLALIIAMLGIIRVQLAERYYAAIPFVKNAFVGKRDVIHLLTGTSWIFIKYPKAVIAILAVSLTILIFIYILVSIRSKLSNLTLYGYMFLLLYSIVMLFEHNINVFFDDIVKCKLEMCLNLSAFRVLESVFLIFRVPRFMHFTNKVLITMLILFLAKILERLNIGIPSMYKDSSKKLVTVIVIFSLLVINASYIVIDMPIITRGATLNPSLGTLILGSRVLRANFFIADWNREKIALEAYLREGLVTNALILYDKGVIVTNVKGFAKALTRLNTTFVISHHSSYTVIRSLKNITIGLPILIPQGLSTGSLVEKYGYIPIYLDQIPLEDRVDTLMRFNVPIAILKDRNFTAKMLALNMLLNDVLRGQHSDSLILVPSWYCVDFNPNLNVWSPGFIGDPHHGIFYEPKGYEYDYTYRLNYGVAQCRTCNSPLKIPFVIKHTGQYTLLLRLMSTGQGVLNLVIDGNQIRQLHIHRTQITDTKIGFEWIEIPDIQLRQGSHKLELYWKPKNKKTTIYVNLIVIVPKSILRKYMETAYKYIEKYGVELNDIYPIRDLGIKVTYKHGQSGEFFDQILLALFNIRSERLYLEIMLKYRHPIAIVTRYLWGDTITFTKLNGIKKVYVIPTDYTKTAFIIVPRNGQIELEALIFKGYTTITSILHLLALIIGIPLSLYILTKFYRHYYILKRCSVP